MNDNESMKIIKNKEKGYIFWGDLQEKGVTNAFSLRQWNFRNQEGMETEYKEYLSVLGLPFHQLVKPLQKHTNNVIVVEQKQNINLPDIHLDYLEGVDGLITNQKNIILATTSADCLCIVLYDSKKKVLANIHSGWRGTFQKIVQKALEKMIERFACNPNDIYAYLMPAIRQCHFEVDEDVMLECQRIFAYTNQMNQIIQKGRIIEGKQKYNIDNVYINQLLLEEIGVMSEHIYDAGICSVCHKESIHSRRAEGEGFGLGTTVVMMT